MKQFQSFFHSKTALIAVICLLTVLALFAGGCSAQTADGSQKPADAAAPSETPETAAPTETSTSEEQAAPGRIRLIGRSGVRIGESVPGCAEAAGAGFCARGFGASMPVL